MSIKELILIQVEDSNVAPSKAQTAMVTLPKLKPSKYSQNRSEELNL